MEVAQIGKVSMSPPQLKNNNRTKKSPMNKRQAWTKKKKTTMAVIGIFQEADLQIPNRKQTETSLPTILFGMTTVFQHKNSLDMILTVSTFCATSVREIQTTALRLCSR